MPKLFAIEQTGRAHRAAIRPQGTSRERPAFRGLSMAFLMTLNGLKAWCLLDTGSTINAISPEFTRVSGIDPFELSNPIALQLGCVGSRSKANFGVETTLRVAGRDHSVYLDVVNVPKYDVVLGLPFMYATGMVIDFGQRTVRIGDVTLPLRKGEGDYRGQLPEQVQAVLTVREEGPAPHN